MNIVSLTYSTGGTVVAETELLGSTTDETVCNEIKSMFGFTTTSWSGRYVVDLNDFSDVPKWAPSTYENQYGVKWQFSGPGLILASSEGGIIVLEEKTDFKSKNLVSISISDEFNAFKYQQMGRQLLDKFNDKNIVIVGGTGLYIKALF